jgi:hypothetical protein
MAAPPETFCSVQFLAARNSCKNLHTKKRMNIVDFVWCLRKNLLLCRH